MTTAPSAMSGDEASSRYAQIDSLPAPGQSVEHNGTVYSTIKEGLAHILVPPHAKTVKDPKAAKDLTGETAQSVFYNPIQQFNRDLSVLAIRIFAEDFAERRERRAGSKSEAFRAKQEKKRLAKQKREAAQTNGLQSNGGPRAVDDTETSKDVSARTTAASDDRGVKRKAEDVHSQEAEGKKPRVEVPAEPTNGTAASAIEEAMEIDPEQASKAPTGQRPDDKLRPTLRILDALSATGLRALRYASELPGLVSVTANDLLPAATAAIKLNVTHNKLSDKITAITSNAQAHMYTAAFGYSSHAYAKYDVIDLDPYGTAVPFLEGALLALNDNGLLCVTCTDAGVFNSMGYLEKTFALYGGIPIKGLHTHEGGLRLILHAIATTAAKHGLSIEPLLSLSIDFYARVWVRVRKSPQEVKNVASKTMIVHSCDAGCGSWTTQHMARTSHATDRNGKTFQKYHAALTSAEKTCHFCGFKTHLAGPMWGGPLHNPWFVGRMLACVPTLDETIYGTTERMEGMLSTALDELSVIENLDSTPTAPATSKSNPRRTKNSNPKTVNDSAPSPPGADADIEITTGDSPPATSTRAPSRLIPSIDPTLTDPHPFYFSPSFLAGVLKCQCPPEASVRGALRHMGYAATRTHAKPGMIKTQAPWEAVWDVMRAWIDKERAGGWKGGEAGRVREGQAGFRILHGQKAEGKAKVDGVEGEGAKKDGDEEGKDAVEDADKPKRREVVFDEALGRDASQSGAGAKKKLVRYQVAPRPNWGPMSRAKG